MVFKKSEPSISDEELNIRQEMLRHAGSPSATQHAPTVSSSDELIWNPMITYDMPKAAVLQWFARAVGEQLTVISGDDRYCDQVVIDGLANFLKVVGELMVKRLNSVSNV